MTTQCRQWAVLALASLGCLLLGGCAGSQDQPALSSAQQMLGAANDQDGEAACALLAPAVREELEQSSGSPCERAVLEEDLGDATGTTSVTVFDTMAQAHVGSETLFLSRFDDRWLVVGAACTPVPDRPYDCSIGMP